MEEKELLKERKKLKEVVQKYKDEVDNLNLRIKNLAVLYKASDEYLMESLRFKYELKRNAIKNQIEKPYFARIDFVDDTAKEKNICYIGKIGLYDMDNNLITVDWRSPIASLYYDSNIGKVKYRVDDEIIEGELTLKRQYDIDKSNLISYEDVDTVSNDEILKKYLGVNKDSRLKNIVASIQKEQNDIIREDISKNLIVEGVAGSGKTTVALHRIAYLIYNTKNTDENQYLVIGPNKFFINYISNILPDLDVGEVKQYTFIELVQSFLRENINIISSNLKIQSFIKNRNIDEYNNIKSTLEYKDAIDKFMDEVKNNPCKESDFKINNYTILKRNEIIKIYNEYKKQYHESMKDIVDKTIEFLSRKIINSKEEILVNILNECDLNNDMDACDINKIRKIISTGAINELKKYFSTVNSKATNIYKEFLNNIDKYLDIDKGIVEATLNKSKRQEYEFEDIAALLYIKYLLTGTLDYKKYRHVVLDEAQDFSIFQFYVLKLIMKNATFSIFGDTSQSIYSYRGIKSFSEVEEIFENVKMLSLNKSYRTTIEILEEANKITKYLKLNVAIPTIRHGRNVEYIKEDDDTLINKIKEYKEIHKSIAIICKDIDESKKVYSLLDNKINNLNLVIDEDTEYNGGICIITSYLVKGLEFDATIIYNVDEGNYDSNNNLDMKLLYVSLTRALSDMTVLYKNNLVEILK